MKKTALSCILAASVITGLSAAGAPPAVPGIASSDDVRKMAEKSKKDPAEMYKFCASCHGPEGKRPAMGKGVAIAGVSDVKVFNQLKQYKAGTLNLYGMGAVMKGNLRPYNDYDLAVVSRYVASMK